VTVHAFLARPFDTTHENEVFDAFLRQLDTKWGQTDEEVIVIGNPLWNGVDPDTVVLRQKSITILDFKNFGGKIQVKENGPWMSPAGPVKGGSKANPFHQVRDNKYAVKQWFEEAFPDSGQEFGHISGLIVFHKPVVVDGELSPKVHTWFRVTDLDHASEALGYFASKGINLTRAFLLDIPKRLGVPAYAPQGRQVSVEALEGVRSGGGLTEPREWTLSQTEAMECVQRFLAADTQQAFRVLGMSSTGKTALIPEIERMALALDRPVVWLAPNARLATRLTGTTGYRFGGIYTHLFTPSAHESAQVETDKGKRKVQVHSFRPCEDAENAVYVIEEAHLLGNSYFEREGERYGSGRLWDDFLAFTDLVAGPRKVILIGDPYQLHRGAEAEMPIHGEILGAKGMSQDSYELERVIVPAKRELLTGNAKSLVQAIRTKMYNRLDFHFDEAAFIAPEKGQNFELALDRFKGDPRSHLLVVYSNKEASEHNAKLHQSLVEQADLLLGAGDRVELYSPIRPNKALEESGLYGTGTLASVITSSSTPKVLDLKLKGRDTHTVWRVAQVGLCLDGDGAEFPNTTYLVDFLESEKPELDADRVIALMVYYKEPEPGAPRGGVTEPPVRLRYAYATTCHHAQGATRPTVIINADTGQGRCSEDYFRWLYTAITRAESEVVLLNHRPLTPLTDARWSEAGLKILKDIPGALTLKLDTEAVPTEEDLGRELPTWNPGEPTRVQLLYWLAVQKCLEPHEWNVRAVASHPYQEQYDLAGPEGATCSISLTYNQAKLVTGIRSAKGTNAEPALDILRGQSLGLVTSDPRGAVPLQVVHSSLQQGEWALDDFKETKYLLTLKVSKPGQGKAKLDVHFNAEGMITTLRVVEATSSEVVAILREALMVPEGVNHG